MEACATAHHWARELTKQGHTVRLMPPAYVKPYVKRGKTDVADAEAIAEAVTRPTMRFVGVKSADQQAALTLHKVRDLLVRQPTMLINALRGHLAEFGIIAARVAWRRERGNHFAAFLGSSSVRLPCTRSTDGKLSPRSSLSKLIDSLPDSMSSSHKDRAKANFGTCNPAGTTP
jgi:transposase